MDLKVQQQKEKARGQLSQAAIDALSYSGLWTLGLNYSYLAGALTQRDAAVASLDHAARPFALPLGSALFF